MSIDWRSLQSSLNKGFSTSVQATKERLGRVGQDEITELPQGACALIPIPGILRI
jgi:hypothetical protein